MLTTQLELLKRLGGVPLDEVVDALRDIHRNGADSRDYLNRLLGAPPGPRVAAPPPGAPAQALESAHDLDYEVARRHFVDHGRRLREQALLAERLLERFAQRHGAVPPVALGHELTLSGPRGGIGLVRFLLVNREREPMEIRFEIDRNKADSSGLGTRLRFDPPSSRLQPGEELEVRLSANLSGWESSDRPIEAGVDVWNGPQLLTRLWVRAEVTDPERSDAQPG